jgi:hypothetical protein
MIDTNDFSGLSDETAQQKGHVSRSATDVQNTHAGLYACIDEKLCSEVTYNNRHVANSEPGGVA